MLSPGNQHYASRLRTVPCMRTAIAHTVLGLSLHETLFFKLSDGYYQDLYAVRSFGFLRRQQMQIRRIPASIHVVSKLCQS